MKYKNKTFYLSSGKELKIDLEDSSKLLSKRLMQSLNEYETKNNIKINSNDILEIINYYTDNLQDYERSGDELSKYTN